MDVGVSELRAGLASWIQAARAGEDVVITEHGIPVARLVGTESASGLEELIKQGIIARPSAPVRAKAGVRKRPKSKGSVADLLVEQRR